MNSKIAQCMVDSTDSMIYRQHDCCSLCTRILCGLCPIWPRGLFRRCPVSYPGTFHPLSYFHSHSRMQTKPSPGLWSGPLLPMFAAFGGNWGVGRGLGQPRWADSLGTGCPQQLCPLPSPVWTQERMWPLVFAPSPPQLLREYLRCPTGGWLGIAVSAWARQPESRQAPWHWNEVNQGWIPGRAAAD